MLIIWDHGIFYQMIKHLSFLSFMSVILKNYTNVINHQVLFDGLSRDVAFILNTGNEILRIG